MVFFGAILSSTYVSANGGSAFMVVGHETSQPIGHYEFCMAQPIECTIRSGSTNPIVLTELHWQQLQQVNNFVNGAISPATDQEMFGVPEIWNYPSVRGDCEDYVLLKRRLLAEQGWPLSALLITVVLQPSGDGHAVLTVRTDRGDFVLDNLEGRIRLWNETPYQYVKRQSERDTGRWVSIENGGGGVIRFVGE